MRKLLLICLATAALAATGCGKSGDPGTTAPPASAQKTPEEAYKAFRAAGAKGDAKALWNCMSAKTRKSMTARSEKQMAGMDAEGDAAWDRAAAELGIPAADLRRMTPGEFTEAMVARMIKAPPEMEKIEMRGDIAVVFTERRGYKGVIALVKEDGTWKMDLEEGQKIQTQGR